MNKDKTLLYVTVQQQCYSNIILWRLPPPTAASGFMMNKKDFTRFFGLAPPEFGITLTIETKLIKKSETPLE